jgi:hypothetical protein
VRLALASLAFAAVTVVTYMIAKPDMFTGFASYDDEGYMLSALRSFLDHGSLYDDVFSQYGPFYYEFWGGVFEVVGLPVDHEGGRTAALAAWVASALLVGLSSWRMTGSALLGLATQMLTFGAIVTVTNEPMHPGGLICLLLAAILAASCFVRERVSPYAMAALGGLVAALILVKINVGVFALAALALVAVAAYPTLASRRWPRALVEVGFVALPLLLMASKLSEAWARHYAVHVAVAALAVVIALRARDVGRRSDEELWWLGGGLVVVALTICVALLGAGTSLGGLLDGVVRQPLRQADAFSLQMGLGNRTYIFDLMALGGALAYWYVARERRDPSPAWATLGSALAILVGLTLALSPIGRTLLFDNPTYAGYQLGLLAFAWVALVPPPGGEDGAAAFARLLLPPLAVLQALHAYPVAGSQVAWSAFLLVPVGALCVANGVRGLSRQLSGERERRALFAVGAVTALAAFGVLVNIQLRQPLDTARAAYDASVPLGLPGAEDVRLSPEEVERYRAVTAAIDRNCAALVTLPGMNSFYFWAEREPPSGFNATAWPTLFDDADQRRVIEATRSTAGLCLLENAPLAAGWSAGEVPEGPLVRYLRRGFQPVVTIGDYQLLKREGTGS